MNLTTFFRPRNHASRQRPPRSRLQLQRLEDRTVPSANIDISNTPGFDVETNIDLNPVNPQNLVAAAMHANLDAFPPFVDRAYFSRDGGRTWGASSPLPLSFQGVDYPGSGDPTVAFDSRGNVYVAYEAADFLSDAEPAALIVAKSSDGGATFTQFTSPATSNVDATGNVLDHPKVTVDRSPTSPFRDTVYMTWINFSSVGADLVVSRSTDGGLSWSAPITFANDGAGVEVNTQTIGPDGTVYVGWLRFDDAGNSTQFVTHSTDGGVTFASHVPVTTLHALPDPVFGLGGLRFPSPAQTGFGAPAAQASLDTDRSAGPFRGRLYMAYIDRPDPDARPFDEDVYLQFSDDQGQTWSPRQRVNDDGLGNSQFFPSLSVDPTNGKVLISWYDTRRDPVNGEKTDVFLAVGNPSRYGVHFHKNLRVTDQQSDVSVDNPQAFGFYGDYEGLVAYGGVAHPVWSDARASNFAAGLDEEVFTAAIPYGGGDGDDPMSDVLSRGGADTTDAAFSFLPAGPAFTLPTPFLANSGDLGPSMPPKAPISSGERSQDNGEAVALGNGKDHSLARTLVHAALRRNNGPSLELLIDELDQEMPATE